MRGKTAVAGVGESAYHKHGGAKEPEYVLALQAILAAARSAGLDPKRIDGFVSFADDRNTALRVANSLGVEEMRWASMQWGGGGAGGSGAVAQAAAAVAGGFADYVVVYRGLAQGQFGRIGAGRKAGPGSSLRSAYGMNTPAEFFASRMTRFMHETGLGHEVQRAISLASYHHAQSNPRAVMYGKPLTPEKYDESRWIVEPWRLFDCCQENDGASALIVTTAERARDHAEHPAYILGAAMGGGPRSGGFVNGIFDPPKLATSEFPPVAARLYRMAGVEPGDVDVVQSYEDFTGGVVMSLIEHGLVPLEDAAEVLRVDNLIAPSGRLPLNTSGGNLAEAYIHGFELHLEGARQIMGGSPNPVPGATVSLVSSGPMVTPASSVIYGSEATL